jgi:hypothetical protein
MSSGALDILGSSNMFALFAARASAQAGPPPTTPAAFYDVLNQFTSPFQLSAFMLLLSAA